MFSGPPLPLPPEFPLSNLVPMISPGYVAGAWVRDSGRPRSLTISANRRSVTVTLGQDLGQLLQSCERIVVREGSVPLLLSAPALIHWRALQVVVGPAHSPCADRLKEIFPQVELDPTGFKVPTRGSSPEQILARCLAQGIPVKESRIVYQADRNSG
jgi:hypothetical protein